MELWCHGALCGDRESSWQMLYQSWWWLESWGGGRGRSKLEMLQVGWFLAIGIPQFLQIHTFNLPLAMILNTKPVAAKGCLFWHILVSAVGLLMEAKGRCWMCQKRVWSPNFWWIPFSIPFRDRRLQWQWLSCYCIIYSYVTAVLAPVYNDIIIICAICDLSPFFGVGRVKNGPFDSPFSVGFHASATCGFPPINRWWTTFNTLHLIHLTLSMVKPPWWPP